MLTIMAIATLILGLFLVYNTINAIITQQINQIGIMKAIGADLGKIFLIYFSMVFVYAVLALVVAVPLGALGAQGTQSTSSSTIDHQLRAEPVWRISR